MAKLRITDAALLTTVKGNEKIPTGEIGNYAVSIDQVAAYTKEKLNLEDSSSVDAKVLNVQTDIDTHKNDLLNPHQVTRDQVGLGNVDNTSDLDKPLSNADITALSLKADKSYVDSQDNLKADKSYVDSQDNLKADKSYVDSQDNLKADKSYVEGLLLLKADKVDLVASKISSDGGQTQQEINDAQKAKNRERISILDFPKTGEYWTETIQAADVYCYNTNKTLYFPNGVYKCDDGIIKRAKWEGEQVCQIGVFPLYDDKVNMVGDKSGLRGTAIIFCGAGAKTYTTLRSDKFSSMRYAVLNIGREGGHTSGTMGRGIVDLSIICDFDYEDAAGNITTPLNDNRADYDVGLLMVDSEQSTIFNICVGGYWKKAGTVHFGQDPDDTHVYDLKTMGNIGLAIIGDGTGTNSGFNGFGCVINSNDHHSRYTGAGEDWGECAFYFDIPSSAMSGSRNGINFYGGTVSTKTNTVGKYDRCGEIAWFGTKFENAEQAGSAQASGEKRQIGTANTGSITFFNARFTTPEQIRGSGKLLETVTNGAVKIIGGSTRDGYEYWKAGVGVRIEGTASQSSVQFTDNPITTTSGMVIRRTLDNVLHFTSDNVDLARFSASGLQFIGMDVSIINVSTVGVTTVNRNCHKLSGGTLDLLTINGGVAGQRLLLNAATNSDQLTLKDGAGNLRLNSDFTTTNIQNYIELIFDGANWCELSRSQNS